jgi:hypothetical protein
LARCIFSGPNVSSAGSLRAGQRVERKARIGITVSHGRKERARRLASRAWFGVLFGGRIVLRPVSLDP